MFIQVVSVNRNRKSANGEKYIFIMACSLNEDNIKTESFFLLIFSIAQFKHAKYFLRTCRRLVKEAR